MTTDLSIPVSILGPQVETERQRIRQQFENGESAWETLRVLCQLADQNIQRVFGQVVRAHNFDQQGLCILALGGYGRRFLFPYSDLDILFLFGNEKAESEARSLIEQFSRTLWDMGFRVSSAGRTIDECKRIEEGNAEFHLALLDRRFLAGDSGLFEKLNTRVLPGSERQARPFLLGQLHKLTEERLTRYGNTIFHLEPNVKESPGGMRDYQAAVWLRQIVSDKTRAITAAEEELASDAVNFLSAIRCFLHYKNGRNDNTLTYELQSEAAARSLGVRDGSARTPEQWMRLYFRQARMLNRLLLRYMEYKPLSQQTLRQRIFGAAKAVKAEPSNGKPYVVRDGFLEILDIHSLSNHTVTFSLFVEAARTGVPLGRETERQIAYMLTHPELPVRNAQMSWEEFKEILGSDYPGLALRPMQRLGLLTEILPEFGIIDSLVVRDFYHRYTVDEHSLRTIEHLQELSNSTDELGAKFSPLWKAVEQRELLVFSLLLHDIGKGMAAEAHVAGSLEALETAAARLGLSPEEKAEVHFLIERHLEMSATMQRRDIFDPGTVSTFAGMVATQERLQRLCLLTYGDIHAVNPEALTPWKAEMLWRLYVAASNHFSRTLDTDRLHISDELALREQLRALVAVTGTSDIERFLEGFPRRYLAVHSQSEITTQFSLYRQLAADPVQTELIASRHAYSLTLLTADRPALFATIAGTLASWGMNIVKADAFANSAGVVLDTFHFVDLHRTFELNPSEIDRFRKNLTNIIRGTAALEPLLKSREYASRLRVPKVEVITKIIFDEESSVHSTLLEIVTQDRPGLLYDIGSALARLECNIEVALIDTEGQKAIDVFYLTEQDKKLTPQKQKSLQEALQSVLG